MSWFRTLEAYDGDMRTYFLRMLTLPLGIHCSRSTDLSAITALITDFENGAGMSVQCWNSTSNRIRSERRSKILQILRVSKKVLYFHLIGEENRVENAMMIKI